jgi:hypothetical protein
MAGVTPVMSPVFLAGLVDIQPVERGRFTLGLDLHPGQTSDKPGVRVDGLGAYHLLGLGEHRDVFHLHLSIVKLLRPWWEQAASQALLKGTVCGWIEQFVELAVNGRPELNQLLLVELDDLGGRLLAVGLVGQHEEQVIVKDMQHLPLLAVHELQGPGVIEPEVVQPLDVVDILRIDLVLLSRPSTQSGA